MILPIGTDKKKGAQKQIPTLPRLRLSRAMNLLDRVNFFFSLIFLPLAANLLFFNSARFIKYAINRPLPK